MEIECNKFQAERRNKDESNEMNAELKLSAFVCLNINNSEINSEGEQFLS